MRFVELPDVRLERAADRLPVDADAGIAVEAVPFVLRHEGEEELRDGGAADVQEVSAADVERASVDDARAAEAARVRFLLEN